MLPDYQCEGQNLKETDTCTNYIRQNGGQAGICRLLMSPPCPMGGSKSNRVCCKARKLRFYDTNSVYIWVIHDAFGPDVFYDSVHAENGICGVSDVFHVRSVLCVFKHNWIQHKVSKFNHDSV